MILKILNKNNPYFKPLLAIILIIAIGIGFKVYDKITASPETSQTEETTDEDDTPAFVFHIGASNVVVFSILIAALAVTRAKYRLNNSKKTENKKEE